MDDVPGDWCSCDRCASVIGSRRGIARPTDSQLSAAERWLEAGTECNGGGLIRTVPRHTHSFGNVHIGSINQLYLACWIPGPIPSDSVARPSWQGRCPSGSVRDRWRRIRGHRLVAQRGTLLQRRVRLCHSELGPAGQTRVDSGKTSFLRFGPHRREQASAPAWWQHLCGDVT